MGLLIVYVSKTSTLADNDVIHSFWATLVKSMIDDCLSDLFSSNASLSFSFCESVDREKGATSVVGELGE